MAAELSKQVVEALKMDMEMTFWTNSTCVLRWIKGAPSTWITFVANRVAKIQVLTENKIWRHVPGLENPADLTSRGINPNQIQNNVLWWEGPAWLKAEREFWPEQPAESITEDVTREARRSVLHCTSQQEAFSSWYVRKFSTFTALLRCTAHFCRRLDRSKGVERNERSGFLKASELKLAEQMLIRCVQREVFVNEWKALSNNSVVQRNSPLRWFNPVMSEEKLIRVGGRLANSLSNEETKHPVVLPARHPFTRLLLEHYHHKLLHAGPQLLLGTKSSNFSAGEDVGYFEYHNRSKYHKPQRTTPVGIQQQLLHGTSGRCDDKQLHKCHQHQCIIIPEVVTDRFRDVPPEKSGFLWRRWLLELNKTS
ncbi:uncharacterized protein LOC129728328 [Wyeomyia smithii]|uniref:uncharacterized protein LOC129728328 n=1 Tax=Wyeomyia smithii TaxID=174621 RepID=UPI00246820A6|nr:uncharacterized protein LOC129728328 [Wyeomyia smithii]